MVHVNYIHLTPKLHRAINKLCRVILGYVGLYLSFISYVWLYLGYIGYT
jgi:hypothetical protein